MDIKQIQETVLAVFRAEGWDDVVTEPNLAGISYKLNEGTLQATVQLVKHRDAEGFRIIGTCFSQGKDVLASLAVRIYGDYGDDTAGMIADRAHLAFGIATKLLDTLVIWE